MDEGQDSADQPSDFVVFNGRRMKREDAQSLQDAQAKTHYFVGGKVLPRVPYGNERLWPPGPGERVCPVCATLRGQLHEPLCEAEQCPACGDRVVSCSCGVLRGDAGES